MQRLQKGFLSKKGERWRKIRLLDAAILLFHVHRGATVEEVGFEDCQHTLDSLSRGMEKKVLLPPALIESCLYSANLLDEKGMFFHPHGKTFDEFLKDVLGPDKFNKIYNWIETKGD